MASTERKRERSFLVLKPLGPNDKQIVQLAHSDMSGARGKVAPRTFRTFDAWVVDKALAGTTVKEGAEWLRGEGMEREL
jgi:hypothetical protein